MTRDPVTKRASCPIDEPLVATVLAGHRGDAAAARRALAADDPRVRDAALGALARAGDLRISDLAAAMADVAPRVRRRACDLAATFGVAGATTTRPTTTRATTTGTTGAAGTAGAGTPLGVAVRGALGDPDALVVEAACWAVGEREDRAAVRDLARVARTHEDARAREAALGALGALGDPRGLAAVLGALGDRPTVRRRAVVALAAFDGEGVAAALARAAEDRDWQVREVAEILLASED